MEIAIEEGDLLMLEIFLLKRLRKSRISHGYLKMALQYRQFDAFNTLVKHGAPIVGYEKEGDNTLLHCVASINIDTNNTFNSPDEIKQLKIIKLLLNSGLDVCTQNIFNETPIHVAFKRSSREVLNILLDHLMKNLTEFQNITDDSGLTLFHIICTSINENYVERVLEMSPSIEINHTVLSDSITWPGFSALHFATSTYRYNTVKLLIRRGADLNIRSTEDLTVLHIACIMDNPYWLFVEAIPNEDWTSFNSEWVKQFLENVTGALNNCLKIVKLLLKVCDINARDYDGNSPLMLALQNNYMLTVSMFFVRHQHRRNSVSPHTVDRQLFIRGVASTLEATRNLRISIVKILTKRSSRSCYYVNEDGLSCLHHIASSCDSDRETVNIFLQKGIDVNVVDVLLRTPLHAAAATCHKNFILLLLKFEESQWEKKLNFNVQDVFGNTPLHYANNELFSHSMPENCLSLLLENGADADIENNGGVTGFAEISKYVTEIIGSKRFEKFRDLYLDTVNLTSTDNTNLCKKAVVKTVATFWRHFTALKIATSSVDQKKNELLKLVSAKLHVTEKSKVESVKFEEHCKHEIDRLKKIHLSSHNTLYSVLVGSIDRVSSYTKNNALREILESPELKVRFPIYGIILKARFIRALARIPLIENARALMKILIGKNIPDCVMDKILCFLNEKQLRDVNGAGNIVTREIADAKFTLSSRDSLRSRRKKQRLE